MIRIVGFLIVCMLSLPAQAIETIKITQGKVNPVPLAFPHLLAENTELKQAGEDILRVVIADLERSGLFRSIERSAYIEHEVDPDRIPTFANWRQIHSAALITGKVTQGEVVRDGDSVTSIVLEWRLWDVYTERQIAGSKLSLPLAEWDDFWRRIAHLMADEIYVRLTGESGYFDTRIVYVSESGPAQGRVKRLAIMDQDGANHKFLTDGKDLVLTPRFSPSMQQIIYLSYANNRPRVYIRDLNTGEEQVVGDFQGMTFAPRFSYDGKKVVMSVAEDGNSDVYVMDIASSKMQRLTYDRAIDTSPSFSPDGQSIVFNSDRGGSQQLYVMERDGSNVRRITFGDGRYGSPVWSPRGDLIAFTRMHRGKFYIGVIRPDGSGERLLTESYMDESPTWAPNGRVIMFTRQERGYGSGAGSSQLYSVDLTGYNQRVVQTPKHASDPAWSPLL